MKTKELGRNGSRPIERLGVDRGGEIVYSPGLAGLPGIKIQDLLGHKN